MLYADADQDGLADDWEVAHGSNPLVYDRDELRPGAAKSWLDEYLESLWPESGAQGTTVRGWLRAPAPGVVPPLTILGGHQPVGALKGALTVAGDGSAAYSIPIDVPKGTAGMEPKLSLDYSSNGMNGMAGLGWSMTGFQQITRGAATMAKDGLVDGVDFDENDRFFFNGERLVCVDGVYGAAGSEYRTEVDSFARIVAMGQRGGGPEWWQIQTKTGLVLELGKTEDARVEGEKGVLSWSVNDVSDTLGNYYAVSYARDESAAGEVINQRVNRVDFTGHRGVAGSGDRSPYASVRFEFESRPDVRTFYTAGIRQSFDCRLKSVVVATGGFENHRYDLHYEASEQTGRSLLVAVEKVVGGMRIPATTFQWRTVGHQDEKWREVSNGSVSEYASGLDSRKQMYGFLAVDDDDASELRLSGCAWRAIPFEYAVTDATRIVLEYRSEVLPSHAMIGLDENTEASNPTRLNRIVGSGTGPKPVLQSQAVYGTGDVGSWKSISFSPGATTGAYTAHQLVLVNDDVDLSDGAGMSEFRNIRVFEAGHEAEAQALDFKVGIELPQMMGTTAGADVGFLQTDLDADGGAEWIHQLYYDADGTNPEYLLKRHGMVLTGGSDGFHFLPSPPEEIPVLTDIRNAYDDSTALRAGWMARPTDLDGDGRAELAVPLHITRANGRWFNDHGFANWDGASWEVNPSWQLPFRSDNLVSYGRFKDFRFIDLDGDGFVDFSATDTDYGRMLEPATGTVIKPAAGRKSVVWLNRHHRGEGWVRAEAYDLPKQVTEKRSSPRFLDVNADGLVDLVDAVYGSGKELFLNTGEGWEEVLARDPRRELCFPFNYSHWDESDLGTRMLDLNGDGMMDVINDWSHQNYNAPTNVYLATGVGWDHVGSSKDGPWGIPGSFTWTDKYEKDYAFGQFYDLNADGLADLTFPGFSSNTAYLNTGSGWWNVKNEPFWATGQSVAGLASSGSTVNLRAVGAPLPIYASTSAEYYGVPSGRFMEVNGDGIVDFVAALHTSSPRVFINLRGPELIEGVTDGFGKHLGIEYTRLNDPTPLYGTNRPGYAPHDAAFDGALQEGQIALNAGGYVVTRLLEPDGQGGIKGARRHYGDLRFDRIHQTSLGFGWIEVFDEYAVAGQEDQPACRGFTRTRFRQEFPFAGSPETVETFAVVPSDFDEFTAWAWPSPFVGVSSGVKLVGREVNAYAERVGGAASNETGPVAIRRPFQLSSVSQKFDMDDAGTLLSQVTTIQNSVDAYGFVESSLVTSLDGSATSTRSEYEHADTGGQWILGRLKSTTVIQSSASGTRSKTSAFAYNTAGLLTSEVVEPGHPLSTTTTYTHDLFGNVIRTTVTASGQSRWSEVAYDPNGRFVISETTPLGTLSHHYSPAQALLLATTDMDGRTTTFTYDGFGTQIATHHPNGTRSAEITRFATNADLPGAIREKLEACHMDVQWARMAEESGKPPAIVWFDSLGREVATRGTVMVSAEPLAFEFRFTYRLFDGRGRVTEESQPLRIRPEGGVEHISATRYLYDFLDRRIATQAPDGARSGLLSVSRGGTANDPLVIMVARNPKGVTSTRWEDQHGRLRQTTDASGLTTEFLHDVENRLLSVRINGQTQLTNTYDQFGNKTQVSDLSAGTRHGTYNGFGEVLTQRNPLGQTTSTVYDSLGRISRVTRPEGVFQYFYRSVSPNRGKLAVITGPSGYYEAFTYGSQDHDYGLTTRSRIRQKSGESFRTVATSYTALGLPHLTTDAGGAVVGQTYDPVYGSFPLRSELLYTPSTGSQRTLLALAPNVQLDGGRLHTTEQLAHGVIRETWTHPDNGHLLEVHTHGLGKDLQHHIYTWDIHGNLTQRKDLRDGKSETFAYDNLDRLTASHLTTGGATATRTYGYDPRGNLTRKGDETLGSSATPTHSYQAYRVTTAHLKGRTRSHTYDSAGRVTQMTYSGTLEGQTALQWTSFDQLQSVTKTSAPAILTFSATGDLAPAIAGIAPWTKFFPSTTRATFEFDASGQRTRQLLTRTFSSNEEAVVDTRYLGNYEEEAWSTDTPGEPGMGVFKTLHRHRFGSALLTYEESSSSMTRLAVVLTDHVGSTDTIIRADWNPSTHSWKTATTEPSGERQSFDAWGERRHGATWQDLRTTWNGSQSTSAADVNRGFTGHEMLDDFGLVHMNGRIYDPELGRFLSPDPYVQVPEFSQNFNRYSYVLNNPLSHTDSTGHFIDLIIAAVVWAVTAIANVLTAYGAFVATGYFTGGLLGALGAAVIGIAAPGTFLAFGAWIGGMAAGTALAMGLSSVALTGYSIASQLSAGASTSDILRGVAVGFVSATLTAGWLHPLQEAATSASGLGTQTALKAAHVAGHGIIGGLSQEAMGGRFQDGVLGGAAGAASSWVPGIADVTAADGTIGSEIGVVGRTAVAGALGGTASVVGGGKFANGAYTAAFQHLLSEGGSFSRRSENSFDAEAARYSESAYTTRDGGALSELGIGYQDNVDGFGAALYGDAKGGYVLAFRGTNFFSLGDWKANVLQAFGFRTSQYEQAVLLAAEVYQRTGGNVTFVGHSLGGGLASAAAGATGGCAITFNSAGVSGTYRGSPGLITANFIRGDILSVGQDFSPLPNAAGSRVPFSGTGGPINRHFIRQFTQR
nr:RHS repeat-associated core domain-containing protein [Haloferula luteola]